MQEPSGYKESAAYTGGTGKQLEPGGYICVIKSAREETNKGLWQLAIAYDIAEGPDKDFYNGIYKFRLQSSTDARWPAVYRQTVEDNRGSKKCSPFFKGFITSIEESNPGYTFNFDEKTLTGKTFGGIFGQEEWQANDGTIKTSTKLVQVRSTNAIREGAFAVPPLKTLNGATAPIPTAPPPTVMSDAECPF